MIGVGHIEEKLPVHVVAAYLIVTFSLEAASFFWNMWALFFMSDVARLPNASVAAIACAYRLWDAINDPIVGALSDRTRHEMGRRRSWMAYFAMPYGILYCLAWIKPFSGPWLGGYFFIVKLLAEWCFTCISLPHFALLNELTPDPEERYFINQARMVAVAAGSLASVALQRIVFVVPAPEGMQFAVIGGSLSAISITAVYSCVLLTGQTANDQSASAGPSRESSALLKTPTEAAALPSGSNLQRTLTPEGQPILPPPAYNGPRPSYNTRIEEEVLNTSPAADTADSASERLSKTSLMTFRDHSFRIVQAVTNAPSPITAARFRDWRDICAMLSTVSQSPEFWIAVVCFVLTTTTAQITLAMFPYYARDWLGFCDVHVSSVIIIVQVSSLVSITPVLVFGLGSPDSRVRALTRAKLSPASATPCKDRTTGKEEQCGTTATTNDVESPAALSSVFESVHRIHASLSERWVVLGLSTSLWICFYLICLFSEGRALADSEASILELETDPAAFVYLAAPLMGVGFSVSVAIPVSMLTDAADFVELKSGKRLEGSIFGFAALFQKVALGLLLAILELALLWSGYEAEDRVVRESCIYGEASMAIEHERPLRQIFALPPIALLMTLLLVNCLCNPATSVRLSEVTSELRHRRHRRQLEKNEKKKKLAKFVAARDTDADAPLLHRDSELLQAQLPSRGDGNNGRAQRRCEDAKSSVSSYTFSASSATY
jgi:Na+/melibiose symporter-like transporter